MTNTVVRCKNILKKKWLQKKGLKHIMRNSDSNIFLHDPWVQLMYTKFAAIFPPHSHVKTSVAVVTVPIPPDSVVVPCSNNNKSIINVFQGFCCQIGKWTLITLHSETIITIRLQSVCQQGGMSFDRRKTVKWLLCNIFFLFHKGN